MAILTISHLSSLRPPRIGYCKEMHTSMIEDRPCRFRLQPSMSFDWRRIVCLDYAEADGHDKATFINVTYTFLESAPATSDKA